jgi:hypothetical protein
VIQRAPTTRSHLLAFLAAAGLAVLTACGGDASAPLPTTVPVAEAPTAAPVEPTATLLPPAPTLEPTPPPEPTPSPEATPCGFSVQPALVPGWDESELGCPADAGQAAISTAYAPFEGGQMLWRSDTDTIYVLTHDNRWTSYPNAWREGDPAFSCGEEASPPTPLRGFGRVWCDHPDVSAALGPVTAAEIGDSASAAQAFARGTILAAPWGSLFVFADEGTWRRVDVEQ